MWLVRRKKILTKDQLMKRGWQGDSSCIFCGQFETIDHLLVNYSIARIIWEWIATFNNFHFQGQLIEDLWILDSCIPLKDKILIKLIKNTVCWVLWLTRNKCIIDKILIPSVRSIGLQIINLAKF
jgi:zinc-binding in reverse transcriptase